MSCQAGHVQVELTVIGHVEAVEGTDAQPRRAWLAHEADEPPLALFEAEVLGDDVFSNSAK